MNINIWNSYIWNADKDRIMWRSSQWRCFNLSSWKERNLKKCRLEREWNFLTSAIPVRRSNQLSYQANWELVNWEFVFIEPLFNCLGSNTDHLHIILSSNCPTVAKRRRDRLFFNKFTTFHLRRRKNVAYLDENGLFCLARAKNFKLVQYSLLSVFFKLWQIFVQTICIC